MVRLCRTSLSVLGWVTGGHPRVLGNELINQAKRALRGEDCASVNGSDRVGGN